MDDDPHRADQCAARNLAGARDSSPRRRPRGCACGADGARGRRVAPCRRICGTCWRASRRNVRGIEARLPILEHELRALADADPVVTQLRTIPGIGLLTATALVGTVGHIHAFRRARQFASWLGLTPREHSSGARRRLGGISKPGDRYLRCLLTHGARAVLLAAQRRRRDAGPMTRLHEWALTVHDRCGHNKATIAVANKLGRIVWAVWHNDVPFAGARVLQPANP